MFQGRQKTGGARAGVEKEVQRQAGACEPWSGLPPRLAQAHGRGCAVAHLQGAQKQDGARIECDDARAERNSTAFSGPPKVSPP